MESTKSCFSSLSNFGVLLFCGDLFFLIFFTEPFLGSTKSDFYADSPSKFGGGSTVQVCVVVFTLKCFVFAKNFLWFGLTHILQHELSGFRLSLGDK